MLFNMLTPRHLAQIQVWQYSGIINLNPWPSFQLSHLGGFIPRYWLVLTFVFLTELFMDQLNLSPSFTLLKLVIMFWFVAPIENNGSHILYEKVAMATYDSHWVFYVPRLYLHSSKSLKVGLATLFKEEFLKKLQKQFRTFTTSLLTVFQNCLHHHLLTEENRHCLNIIWIWTRKT